MSEFVIRVKKKKEYEQFTCRIEADLLEEIRKIVIDNDLPSVNEFINECLRYSMDNITIMEETDEWIQKKWFINYLPKMGTDRLDVY